MGPQQYNRTGRQRGQNACMAAIIIIAVMTMFPASGSAQSDASDLRGSLADALTNGAPWLNLRYRFEQADQAGTLRSSRANTLRARIGYATDEWHGLSFLLELGNTSHVGQDDFDDGSDAVADRAVILDPDSTEVNQVAVRLSAPRRTEVTAGRHRVVLDNERFFGDADFRQNQQTFDGFTLVNLALLRIELRYDYLSGVQRPQGSDSGGGSFNTAINILHATYRAMPSLTASAYGYFADIDDDASLSARTIGARILGDYPVSQGLRVTYAAEIARQSDFADNPASFSLDYYRVEPGLRAGDASVSAGLEVLEGNGNAAVQTPFATLHRFQGFADVFTLTPANGIEDRFVAFAYKKIRVTKLDSVRVWGAYHEFRADQSGVRYGSEIDAAVSLSFSRRYRFTAKNADYNAPRFGTDIERFWLILQLNL